MTDNLKGMKIAILSENGFEQSELMEPKKALEQAGAQTFVVSPQKDKIKGWKMMNWGDEIPVDVVLTQANPDDYDALLLPGGVINPDKLRMQPEAVRFVQHFLNQKKPIAAICHGPWMLVESGAVKGKTVTSWPSIRTDIINAGGQWVDQEVVVDGNIVTSRKPDDLPAFNKRVIALLAERQPALNRM
ncbi:MAG: yfkM [Vampirovibrio sp.]|nr:yfkM [Vampirovibrio sp.]